MIDRMQWHKWFAWYPIETLGHHWAWLKVVERRWNWDLNYWGDAGSGYSGTDGGWEYKLLEAVA
jgi:hypothetical protein